MSPSFPHLPAEAWAAFLEDRLEGDARARVETHVDDCAACRGILFEADPSRAFRMLRVPAPEGTWDGFWERLEPALREPARPRGRWIALAAAASVVGVSLLVIATRPEPPPPDPCAAPQVAALKLSRAECEALYGSGGIEAAEREVIVVRDLDLRGFEP